MSKSLQRGILFSICVALILALSLTLVFFAGGGDKNILSAPQGQVSATAQNTTSYTHGSYIKRQVPSGVKTVSTGIDFITAVSDNQSVSLASDVALGWNEFGIQAEGISGGWSVDKYTGTIYGNGYTVSLSGLNTTGEVYPASGFNNKAYAGGIVRELGSGGAIYDLNVVVDGHIRVLGASGQYLDLGILVGQMNSNSTIDNCTVTVNNGKSVESMKMSSSILWARLGLFVGKFADNASNMRITNVTATHNGTIEVGLGTTSGWGGTAGGGNTDEGAQGFAGLIFGAASKSATNITLDNIVVAGSGVIWSYAGAPIGMLMGNTAVTINNFFNKTTNGSLFKAIQDNRMSNTILDWGRNGDNVQGRVVNHYRSSQAQQATADDNNGINVTNTITVSNDNIGKIYFDPNVSDYANSLTIVHDTTNAPVDSANERVYTITGQNNYSATSKEITLNGSYDRVIFRNLSSTASNWKNGGNFGYNVTYKDTPRFNDYRDDLKFYEHGYATSQTKTDTPISSGDDWLSHFGQNASGGGDSSSPLTGNYYLTKDIVISGFSGKFFNGTFDGNGHTIYITGVSQDSYGNPGIGGVIGTLMSGGSIKNMRVVLVNELTVNGPSNGRVGGVVGHIQGGTLENVTVLYDDTAALISETTSNDITIGGVAGRATSGAQIKNVTLEMESGSRLAPSSGWTYLAGVVGIIDAANGATFENIVMRGTGNFNAHSDNADEPPYYAAIANTKAENYNGSGQYASIDGLIYDFDAQLNGTFNGNYGDGQDHCSMYYFFSNNWNGGSGSVGSYHNLVSYNNIFIAEGKGGNLAENVGDRFSSSSGNAPIMIESDTTPYTIASGVTAAAGRYDDASVTAYFQPVDVTIGSDYNYAVGDLVLKVSRHNWQEDESLMVNVGGDTGKVISYLEDPNEPTSDRIVKLTKDQAVMAATNNSNTVQVSDFLHVAQPQLANELTYTGSGIDVTFVVRYESESGSAQMGEELPNTAYTVSIKKKEGGTGSVVDGKPVNAGEYVATITLTNGDTFLVSGTGGDSTTATVEFSVKPFTVQGTWELSGLTLTYGDPVPSDIDQYINITLTSQNIPGGLDADAVTVEGFTTDYTQGTAAGTTVNVTAVTFVVGDGFTASNYDLSGITGSGSVQVQKKELTITNLGDDASHITDSYGSNVTSLEDLATLFETEGMSYVQGVYENQAVTFTITAFTYDRYYDDGALEEGADATSLISGRLYAKTYYTATVTLASDNAVNDNYELAEGSTFVYYIEPLVIEITGAEFAGGGTSVLYDGNAHEIQVVYTGALDGDNLTFTTNVFYNSESFEGTQLTNAGSYEVTVGFDPQNVFHGDPEYNYDIVSAPDEVRYTLTITPVTLTINDVNAVYTDITAAEVVIAGMVIGILEGDSEGVTIDVVWDTTPADENGYLAAGTYNATLSLSGDKSANYTFGSDDIATVTVDKFDLSGAHIIITSEQFTYDRTEKTVEYTVLTAEGGKDITALLTAEGDKQTNANAKYTVTLSGDDNFTGTAAADWSIDQKTLTVSPYEADFLDYDLSSLYAYLTSADSGLIVGAIEGETLTFSGTWATVPTTVKIGEKSYVAAGSYTLNISVTDSNYKFDDNAMSVTVNALDISGAEVAVTWNESDLTYTAQEQSVTLASVTVNGVDMPVEWFNLTDNAGTDADTYTATVAASNANITGSVSKDFTIAPFAVTVKWEAAGEISVGTAMPADATDMSALDLTARVTEFKAPGITDAAQYSIVVTASGFDAGHIFTTGEKVKLTPSMTFGQGAKENNYVVTFDPETIEKAATAISVEVSPAKETVSVTYGDSVKSADGFISTVYFSIMSGAVGSALTPDNFTVTVTDENGEAVFGTHGLDAGTYTVTIEGKGAYSVSNENNSFTYTVAPLTLTAGNWSDVDGLTYNGKAAAPVFEPVGVLDGDNVSFGYTIVGDKATDGQAINAGSYTVTAKLEGDDAGNYEFDGKVNVKTFTIAQMVLQGGLTVESDLTYDGTSKADKVTLTWTIAPLKEGDVTANITFTKDGEQADPIAAGDYTAIVTLTDNTGNYDTTEITSTVDFTIEQREVVLNWKAVGDDDLVYDGAPHELTATVGNKVDGDVVTVSVKRLDGNNNIDVTPDGFHYVATGLTGAAASNYKLPENAQSEAFNVTPAKVTLTWNFKADAKITYGDSVDVVKDLVNIDALNGKIPGVADPLTFEVSVGEYSATTNAGTEVTFTVTAKLPEGAKANNYEITVKAAEGNNKLTVQRANITVTVRVEGKTYDGAAVTPSVSVMFGERELESSEYGTVTYTYVKGGATLDAAPADASDSAYTVTANVAESTNFNAATSAAVEFNIARKILTAGTWSDVDGLTYNGKAAAPVFKPEGVLDSDNVSVGYTIEGDKATNGQAINAGEYTVTAKLEGDDAGNYEFDGKVNVKTFTISPKTVSVKWDDTELTYNGSAQKPTATVGEEQGLVAGDDLQITVNGEQTDVNTSGGSYTATAEITGGADKDNYVLDKSSVSTAFTIKPKTVNVTLVADSGDTIDFDVAGSVTVVGAWTADGSDPNNKATLTLSDGVTDVTLTAEANEALPSIGGVPALVLLLDNEIYEGTPYGTEVKGGRLTVVSADKNYVFEVAQAITLNITPAISVGLKADVETERGLTDVLKTAHNAEYFKNNYFKVSNKDGAEVTGGTLEVTITPPEGVELIEGVIKHAGTYTVTAVYTPEGAGDGAEKPTFSFEFIVTPVKVTSVTYSGEPLVYGDLSASGKIAVTVEYADGKTENVTAQYTSENVSTARYVKAGEQTIKVSYTNDDSDYAAVTEHEIKLTVKKKTITPSAISYGGVTSEGTTLTLPYAGKSAYVNGNLEIEPNGILSKDVVEFMSEGDYSAANEEGYTPNVTIKNYGDGGNYKLNLSGWKVVVLKKTIEVTVRADSDTYTGSAITLTATSEEVVKGDDVTFTVGGGNGDGQTVTNAGTYDLTVTLGGEQGGNYEVAGELSVTINKARVNIVWTNETELESAVYNGQPYEVKVDVRFNGQSVGSASIKYTSDEVTVTDGKAVNAGSYTATATFAGTDNFNASSEYYGFTIAKKVLDGEWKVASDMDLTYDGTSKAGYATWTWTTAAPLNEGDVTVGYKYELNGAIVDDVIDAGNYNVYAVFTDNTGNYDTESGILQGDRFDELTVARRAVTVEWSESVSFTYNGAEQAPTATALNVAQGDSLTLIVTGAETDAGSYTATVEADSVTGNYVLAADATVEFTIARKTVSVAWGTTEFTYNGSAQVPTATATGLVDGDSLTLTVTGAQMNAGSYTATVAAFEQGNYKLAEKATSDFTIKKADLTVTPASLEIREREKEVMQAFAEGENLVKAFEGRISVSGVSETVTYTVTIAGEDNYDDEGLLTVGAHTFTIDAGSNYNAASVSVTVIATPVVTVIASVEGELVYNGSAFEISYALKEGAPEDVSMDDITVTPSVETIVNAGEYEVTFTVTGSNEDYDYVVQDASGNAALTFTIARRGLDVAEVAEAVYGNLQVSGTLVTGTHSAFVAYNDEEIELIVNVKTAALSRAAAEYLDAGEYEVTIALANENGNFSLNGATLNAETEKMEVQSTLDVAPKTVEVGYTTSSPVYDAKGISVTLDKFEGMLIEGDDPAVNIYINDALYTGGKVVLDAGTYTVRYESADPNYAFEPVSATFTVESKKVTPSFDLNTGTGSQQITGGGKLEIEEGEETDIVAAIDNFMQSSGVSEEELSISVSGDLKLEDMATWAPGTYTVTVTLSGNHSGSMQFTVEVSEKVELPPPVQPELPENPVEAGSGNDWVLPLVIAIVALIDLALLVAIGVAAKKRA